MNINSHEILQLTSYVLLTVAALATYLAASVGPYAAGKRVGRKELIDDLVGYSLENPAGFEIWLRKHQIETTEKETRQLSEKLSEKLSVKLAENPARG